MLRILITHLNGHKELIEWTLESTTRPFHPKTWEPRNGDLLVLADGPELGWIRQHFTGIPFVNAARQIRWYGSDAVFIANNIPCVSGPYSLSHES